MQKGIQNEINFKNLLDNKKVYQLPNEVQEILFFIFENITLRSTVYCWRSKYNEKADIKIKINGVIKGISIKSGKFCSMHQENIKKFYPFLLKIGVDNKVIELFDKYLKGIINNKKVSAAEYIEKFPKDVDVIRNKFNEYYIKINLIIRFIFQGTEIQKYDCDALIYGTPESFIWATKKEILEYLVNYQIIKESFINISALNIKCYDRNLRNNPLRIEQQDSIQIKWYSIEDDLKNIIKKREQCYKNLT